MGGGVCLSLTTAVDWEVLKNRVGHLHGSWQIQLSKLEVHVTSFVLYKSTSRHERLAHIHCTHSCELFKTARMF